MRNIIYIVNPISGTGPKKALEFLIEQKTKAAKIPFQIFPSVESGDYSFLLPIIKEQKITDVVIAGGDGTISQVVSSLMDHDLNFGIIPCGSGNGLAYTLKIPKQHSKAIDIIFTGKASAIDGFYINDQFACMLCGLGFDAKVAHDFARQPQRGLTTYIKQVVKNFFAAKTFHFELKLNGKAFSTDAYFISIANSNQFGNNFTIAPQASLSDGLLDIVIVKKMNRIKLVWAVIQQIRTGTPGHHEAKNFHRNEVLYFQADKLIIRNPSLAPMHIDGEPIRTAKKIEVQVLPGAFKLLMP